MRKMNKLVLVNYCKWFQLYLTESMVKVSNIECSSYLDLARELEDSVLDPLLYLQFTTDIRTTKHMFTGIYADVTVIMHKDIGPTRPFENFRPRSAAETFNFRVKPNESVRLYHIHFM